MKDIGGYQDPLVFCQMSHFQEPTPKRYSLAERSFRTVWNRLTLPQIFSIANLIIVVTPFEKEAKLKMGADPEKFFLFPGGVDDEVFLRYANADVRRFVEALKIKQDSKIVSFLGSLEERKNPMAIIKIAEILKERTDIHFVLAGKGGSPYAEKVIQESKSNAKRDLSGRDKRAGKSAPNQSFLHKHNFESAGSFGVDADGVHVQWRSRCHFGGRGTEMAHT